MNPNDKISELGTGAGLVSMRVKVNEQNRYLNWLMSMRTAQGQISGGGRGPVIDTGAQPDISQPTGPWMTDPDGNPAGWVKMTMMNLANGQLYDAWVWAGPSSNLRPIPWWTDTNGTQAGWLIGAQGELWGTGSYPAGAGAKYQQVKFPGFPADPSYNSPVVWTGNVTNTPIVPPSSPPVLFFRAPPNSANPGNQAVVPITSFWMTSLPVGNPAITINFNWQITYDGTVIFNISGSTNFVNPKVYIPISATGWTFDPTGLPGYTQGENAWIYLYNGAISSNTNPTIIQTFTYTTSNNATVEPDKFGVTLYTG